MSLRQWADNGWLRPHKTSAKVETVEFHELKDHHAQS